jgi:YidC/Oxa1 family membrane protein insertase
MFEIPAALLAWFYSVTHDYVISIALIAVVVMAIITPLTLKSTKGMLEMQRLAPEMRKLQQLHRNDRQKLNEEMMKLYQEHKVNPMSSCLPLLAQMPVFLIMFRILHGLTYTPTAAAAPIVKTIYSAAGQEIPSELGFVPRYISHSSDLYTSLFGQTEMNSFGLDLAKSPAEALGEGLASGLIYALLVVALAVLYFLQQRMVAARAAVSPTMSPAQQKLMQYLPVAFAVFQVFFLTGLIIYYMAQAVLRIAQQAYITRRFYGHEESLGRQAQRASDHARELAKNDGGGSGLFGQLKPKATDTDKPAPAPAKTSGKASGKNVAAPAQGTSKRTTAPKGRPTPTGKSAAARPKSASPSGRPGGSRSSKSDGKRRR